MNTKVLVGGVIGGVVFFLLGWVIYGMLLGDTMNSYMNPACTKAEADMNLGVLALGNLFWGLAFSYILSNWSGTMSIQTGAIASAIIGVLIAAAYDLMIYSTSTVMTSMTGVFIDLIITAVMCGIVGAAIGWWLSRK